MDNNKLTLTRQEIELIITGLNLLPASLREKIAEKRETADRIGKIFGFAQNPVTEQQEDQQMFELYKEIYSIKIKLSLLMCKQEITTQVEFYEN